MIDIVDVKGAVKNGEVKAYVKEGIIYLAYCNTEETVMIGEYDPFKNMTIGEVFKAVFPDLEAKKIYYDNEPLLIEACSTEFGRIDLTLKTWNSPYKGNQYVCIGK